MITKLILFEYREHLGILRRLDYSIFCHHFFQSIDFAMTTNAQTNWKHLTVRGFFQVSRLADMSQLIDLMKKLANEIKMAF